jgi:hypothetical protein
VVGILRRAQRWRVVFVLLICRRWHFFLLLFSFGLGCAAAPAKLVVSCGCYINIAGRKPVSREDTLPLHHLISDFTPTRQTLLPL